MPDPDGPQKKFWEKVRKALESEGNEIGVLTNNVAFDMSIFDGNSLV